MPEIINAKHVGAAVVVDMADDVVITADFAIVQHGANASVARPAAGTVYWQGSVDPTNKALGDFWLETAVYD